MYLQKEVGQWVKGKMDRVECVDIKFSYKLIFVDFQFLQSVYRTGDPWAGSILSRVRECWQVLYKSITQA